MIDHIKEYLEELNEVHARYGLYPVLDPKGDAFMLVNFDDRSRVVTWLNSEELIFRENAADVDVHELKAIIEDESEDGEET